MKNYVYDWTIKSRGYVEADESTYNERQLDMKKFIASMSTIIKNSNCGWDGVRYEVMKHDEYGTEEYMVLYCNGGGARWIPIDGNSKGCNFSVLGENLW